MLHLLKMKNLQKLRSWDFESRAEWVNIKLRRAGNWYSNAVWLETEHFLPNSNKKKLLEKKSKERKLVKNCWDLQLKNQIHLHQNDLALRCYCLGLNQLPSTRVFSNCFDFTILENFPNNSLDCTVVARHFVQGATNKVNKAPP